MVLSKKQREELHKAIHAYLEEAGFKEAAAAFQREAKVETDSASTAAGLLEKKWTSVLRLQKKVMELEGRVTQLESEGGGQRGKREVGDGLPRGPSRHVLAGHRAPITSVAFHPRYSQVATASEDATIKLWDSESGEFERTLKGHTNAVQGLAYEPTGGHLASCSADLTIKLWDLSRFECVKTLHGHDHNVSSVCYLSEGEASGRLLSASRDKTIKLWDTQSGYCLKTLKGHEEWVRMVRAGPGGLLASCSNDQTARLWDLARGECVAVLREHTHVVECVALGPPQATPRLVATGSRDKLIKLWDSATALCVQTLAGHDNWVRGLALLPDGIHLLSVSDDRSIRIWDLRQERCTRTITDAHSHFISCLDYTPNGPLFATGGVDDVAKIWPCRS